jgi:hypothetical protein
LTGNHLPTLAWGTRQLIHFWPYCVNLNQGLGIVFGVYAVQRKERRMGVRVVLARRRASVRTMAIMFRRK